GTAWPNKSPPSMSGPSLVCQHRRSTLTTHRSIDLAPYRSVVHGWQAPCARFRAICATTGMSGSTDSLTSHHSAIGGLEGGTKSRLVESVAGHHLQMPGCTQDAPQLPIERMGQLTRRTVERERTERQAMALASAAIRDRYQPRIAQPRDVGDVAGCGADRSVRVAGEHG